MYIKDDYLYVPLPDSNTIYKLNLLNPTNDLVLYLENFGEVLKVYV
jgi:hypothetical protein